MPNSTQDNDKNFDMRTDLPFIKNLIQGRGCCVLCHSTNSVAGIVKLDANSLAQHAVGAKHVAAAEADKKAARDGEADGRPGCSDIFVRCRAQAHQQEAA